MVITLATLPYVLGYVALGFVCWLAVDKQPGGRIGLRYLIGDVVVGAGFVSLVWFVAGVFHPILVLMTAIVLGFNAYYVRFCAVCGTLRRRWSERPCKRCGSDEFVGLREALSRALPSPSSAH